MTGRHEERRNFRRMAVDSSIEYRREGAEAQCGSIRDLSASGVRFTAPQALASGTQLRVVIRGGAHDKPLTGTAVVLRCVPGADGYEVACSLDEIE